MHGFPGYRIENWANKISSKFGLPPSGLARALAGGDKVATHIVYILSLSEMVVRFGFERIGIYVVSGAMSIVLNAVIVISLKSLNQSLLYMGLISLCNSLSALMWVGKPEADFAVISAKIVANLLLAICLSAKASEIEKQDRAVFDNGTLPQKRDRVVLTSFLMVGASMLLNLFQSIIELFTHNQEFLMSNFLVVALQVICALAMILCLCTPRTPAKSKSTKLSWTALFARA